MFYEKWYTLLLKVWDFIYYKYLQSEVNTYNLEMKGSLYMGQILCVIFCIVHSEFVQKIYTKTEGTTIHKTGSILKEFAIPSGPGELECAIACLQTTGCESFIFEDSVCQLQKNGYGTWKGGKEYHSPDVLESSSFL